MRHLLGLALLFAVTAPITTANAQNPWRYPWCAEYGDGNGGRNCGFETYGQCQAAISGDNSATCIRTGPPRRARPAYYYR